MSEGRAAAGEGEEWVGVVVAAKRLGVSVGSMRKLGESGRVATRVEPGMERGMRYSASDVAAVREHRANPVEMVVGDEQGFDLMGHVPDWTDERFVDRLRSCWYFLMGHGYLDRDQSEVLRARIDDDVARARTASELVGRHELRVGEAVTEVWTPAASGILELQARFFGRHHRKWAIEWAKSEARAMARKVPKRRKANGPI